MNTNRPGDDRKAFLGRGWAMPVALDPRTGLVDSVAYEEDIRQSILIILETAPGERVMRPDFGCGIHDLVFAPNNAATLSRVTQSVRKALTACEPRIDVLDVAADSAPEQDNVLLIRVSYRIRANNAIGNLVYPFYIQEAS